MKFLQLEIGAPFEFKGERYTKAGPFSAVHTATGKDRMMMRSASITPLTGERAASPEAPKVEWDVEKARQAIGAYHRRCLEVLDAPSTEEATEKLEAAYRQLLQRLSL